MHYPKPIGALLNLGSGEFIPYINSQLYRLLGVGNCYHIPLGLAIPRFPLTRQDISLFVIACYRHLSVTDFCKLLFWCIVRFRQSLKVT